MIFEAITTQPLRAEDQADERLAEGAAPGAHRLHVPQAGRGRPVGMRVQESQHVVPCLLPCERPQTVEANAGPLADRSTHAPAIPNTATALTEQGPAEFALRWTGFL